MRETTIRWACFSIMAAVYEAFDWMLPGQFEAFRDRKACTPKFLIAFSIAFLMLNPLAGARASIDEPVGNDFIGTWKGEGRIIVTWSKQKQLSFVLQIDKHGNVRGNIGNALIQDGKIRLNNIFYRWLGNRNYIIDAKLTNYLVESEKIKRESIRIFLDYENNSLVGGFHTSGSKFGGKEKMILSGTGIKLIKMTE